MSNEACILSCLAMAAVFFACFALFAVKKEKGADYVAGFNSLTDSQKARYDRTAISQHYREWSRMIGEICLLSAAAAHWLGLWAFIGMIALTLISCGREMHIDWEKAFEKYLIKQTSERD